MPVLDSYLFFNGDCAQAIRFYERTLGAKLEMIMTYGQSPQPEQCPANSADRIMHARLLVDGRALMASDVPQDYPHKGMSGFALSLNYPTAEEAKGVFGALAEGGSVTMPVAKTFWADAYGILTDRFGTQWMVSGGAQPA